MNNAEIRRRVIDKRKSLSDNARLFATNHIHKHLLTSDLFERSQHVACYVDMNGEVPTARIIHALLNAGKNCYLPCIATTPQEKKLIFAEFTKQTPMIENRFGIPEPDLSAAQQFEPQHLDLVLAPLVAFDGKGNRLGMGQGYYDHTFAFNKKHEKSVTLIGLAYDFQYSENITTHEKDIPLKGVVTESGCRIYSSNSY